jgi:hypothetical protein
LSTTGMASWRNGRRPPRPARCGCVGEGHAWPTRWPASGHGPPSGNYHVEPDHEVPAERRDGQSGSCRLPGE